MIIFIKKLLLFGLAIKKDIKQLENKIEEKAIEVVEKMLEVLLENQKYKEVIGKISKLVCKIKEQTETTSGYPSDYIDNLLDVLKEVSHD